MAKGESVSGPGKRKGDRSTFTAGLIAVSAEENGPINVVVTGKIGLLGHGFNKKKLTRDRLIDGWQAVAEAARNWLLRRP